MVDVGGVEGHSPLAVKNDQDKALTPEEDAESMEVDIETVPDKTKGNSQALEKLKAVVDSIEHSRVKKDKSATNVDQKEEDAALALLSMHDYTDKPEPKYTSAG